MAPEQRESAMTKREAALLFAAGDSKKSRVLSVVVIQPVFVVVVGATIGGLL